MVKEVDGSMSGTKVKLLSKTIYTNPQDYFANFNLKNINELTDIQKEYVFKFEKKLMGQAGMYLWFSLSQIDGSSWYVSMVFFKPTLTQEQFIDIHNNGV